MFVKSISLNMRSKSIKNYGTMPFDMMPCVLFPKQQIRSCGVSTEVNILTTKLFLQPLRLALRATSPIYGVNFYTGEAGSPIKCSSYFSTTTPFLMMRLA